MIELDRREFLKLAAAMGLTAAGSAILGTSAFGQSPVPFSSGATGSADPIADLAASLGGDVERIFRFVADGIRYEPYPGMLRGAEGTLTAGAGNSADQAVLLAALLRAAGHRARFAIAAIDPETVERLVGQLPSTADAVREDALRALSRESVGDFPGTRLLDDEAARAFLTEAETDSALVVDAARRGIDAAAGTIVAALEAAGVSLPPLGDVVPAIERERYVWIQVAAGDQWYDLDPADPGVAGKSQRTPDATMDELPDELRHRVVFQVEVEMLIGGELQRVLLLEHADYADALPGVPVVFLNAKSEHLGISGLNPEGVMSGTVSFNAVLNVADRTIVGTTPLSFMPEGGGGFFDALGGGGPADGETTGQWLTVRVESPGAEPAVSSREIFDRIGAAARASGSIDPYALPPVQLVDLDDDLNLQTYLPCLTVHALSVTGGPVGARGLDPSRLSAEEIGTLAVAAQAYHLLRDVLFAEVGPSFGLSAHLDGPNVASWTMSAAPSNDEGVARYLGFDIWHRNFATHRLGDVDQPYPGAVVAGVMSHTAERIAFRDGIKPEPAPQAIGVAVLFEAAAAAGIGTRVLLPGSPVHASYGPMAITRIREALDAGNVVVIPERPIDAAGEPRVGWWVVDPASGRTFDQMDTGGGAEQAEYTLFLSKVARAAYCAVALAEKILALAAVASNKLGAKDLALLLAAVAVGFWFLNFFVPVLGSACRSGVIKRMGPIHPP